MPDDSVLQPMPVKAGICLAAEDVAGTAILTIQLHLVSGQKIFRGNGTGMVL